jgi:hypothetical protein
MGMSNPKRYVDAGSYVRGSALYQKQLSRWRNVYLFGTLSGLTGAGFAWGAFSSPSFWTENFVSTSAAIFAGIAVLGALAWSLAKYMLRRHKLGDFVYRISLHFMHDMDIPQPHKVLAQNPRYLEAFEEVRAAVTAKEAENSGVGVRSQSQTPLSRRIGSLVLRGEESLASCPRLLSLIEDRGVLDYDDLATLLDSMNELPPSIAEGAL